MECSTVFDETYRRYHEEIRQLDFLVKAEMLGVKTVDGALKIPLYDKIYSFGADGIVGEDGEDLTPIPIFRGLFPQYGMFGHDRNTPYRQTDCH